MMMMMMMMAMNGNIVEADDCHNDIMMEMKMMMMTWG